MTEPTLEDVVIKFCCSAHITPQNRTTFRSNAQVLLSVYLIHGFNQIFLRRYA
jgi:hypothetical protein